MLPAEHTNSVRNNAEARRLAWHCRRGMLELDIILQRFVAYHFETLSLAELQQFDAMLALPDNEFWALINEGEVIGENHARNTLILKLKAGYYESE
ncbi:MAG: FAD assembly factor SdhE [Methylophilaceae bacterium]